MRILISAYACQPGQGSEPGVGWNVARQIARHHEVFVITRANNRESIEQELLREPDLHLHFLYFDLPRWARWWKRGKRGINLYYYLWQLGIYWKARQLEREVGFDIIHHVTFVRYWTPSFLALLPVPFVWGPVGGAESAPREFREIFGIRGTLYEVVRDLIKWFGEHDPFVRLTAGRSRLALATTHETAARLRQIGCRSVKLCGESGLDEETVRLLAADPADRDATIRFVSVGRLLHWKGFLLGLRAFAQANLPKAEYWVIGSGPERRRLEAEARRAGISRRVRFWGALPRRLTLERLLEADILVHPSLHDSGGWVCLEGMAAGKPILCLELGGPAVQVTDETGIRIKARTPDKVTQDLSEAMVRLAEDARLRQRMGEAGRSRVQKRYIWDRRGEEYAEIYRMLVTPRTPGVDSGQPA
jgi:glycosyltransferase involved in cell wall biosynthesis